MLSIVFFSRLKGTKRKCGMDVCGVGVSGGGGGGYLYYIIYIIIYIILL